MSIELIAGAARAVIYAGPVVFAESLFLALVGLLEVVELAGLLDVGLPHVVLVVAGLLVVDFFVALVVLALVVVYAALARADRCVVSNVGAYEDLFLVLVLVLVVIVVSAGLVLLILASLSKFDNCIDAGTHDNNQNEHDERDQSSL